LKSCTAYVSANRLEILERVKNAMLFSSD
jgi:hypothetical protein